MRASDSAESAYVLTPRFYETFPGAFAEVTLSRVGFSFSHSQALVSVDLSYGARGVWSGWYLLTKKDGQWVVTETITTTMA
jgi:hypothetical protein